MNWNTVIYSYLLIIVIDIGFFFLEKILLYCTAYLKIKIDIFVLNTYFVVFKDYLIFYIQKIHKSILKYI